MHSGAVGAPDPQVPVGHVAPGVRRGPELGQDTWYWWYKHFLFQNICSRMHSGAVGVAVHQVPVGQLAPVVGGGPDQGQGTSYGCCQQLCIS